MESVCFGCEWTDTLLASVFQNRDRFVSFLISHNLIRTTLKCPTCLLPIPLNRENLLFACENVRRRRKGRQTRTVRCKTVESAFKGSFLEQAQMKLDTVILLIYVFVSPMRNTQYLAQQLNISQREVVDWFTFCREVLLYYCVVEGEKLGGQGRIVEVHEAKFGRKYTKGLVNEGKWLIGGVQRDIQKVFLVAVDDCKKDTLVETIKHYVLPETTIITDSWSSFKTLANHGYTQRKLDNTDSYVDPETGEYTPDMKDSWKTVRALDTGLRRAQYFETYLAELLFKKMYVKQSDRFHHFLLLASQLYSQKFYRKQQKHEEWVRLPKRDEKILTSTQHIWLAVPPVFHSKDGDRPENVPLAQKETDIPVADDTESVFLTASPRPKYPRKTNINSEKPSPSTTRSELMLDEDIKQEEPDIKEEEPEECMEENFEFKEENIDLEIKEEKAKLQAEVELKVALKEEEPEEDKCWIFIT